MLAIIVVSAFSLLVKSRPKRFMITLRMPSFTATEFCGSLLETKTSTNTLSPSVFWLMSCVLKMAWLMY